LLQLILILSGNLSFLNWLTIIPALACFDDGFWRKILPRRLVQTADQSSLRAIPSRSMTTVAWVVTVAIGFLSFQPVVNMMSSGQIMNTSFDPLDLVNTYGAFGSVGQERFNVVFEGTMDTDSTDNAHWTPYIYKGLPVANDKRPPQIAPYQLRLDWQMWFAAMSSPEEYPWTINLVSKLLHNDRVALSLFAGNPFPDEPPRYVRAVLYRYSFAEQDAGNQWWNRERLSLWLPPMSKDDPLLVNFLKAEDQ